MMTRDRQHLSAIVQAQRFSLFGHLALSKMPDETDATKILTASPLRTGGDPHTTWLKTIP